MMLWRMMSAAACGLKGTVGYGDSEEFSSNRGGVPRRVGTSEGLNGSIEAFTVGTSAPGAQPVIVVVVENVHGVVVAVHRGRSRGHVG
jgi:hypothetical protein